MNTSKSILYIRIFSLLLIAFSTFSCCHKELKEEEENEMEEESCLFQFDDDKSTIVGAWETTKVTVIETQVTTEYEEGHLGFMLGDYYADAMELRPNEEAVLYYVSGGRYCEDRVDATWELIEDSLFFRLGSAGNLERGLEIIEFTPDVLTVKDQVNFKPSIVEMTRAD